MKLIDEKLLVISNMYPDKRHPSYGVFVARFVDQAIKLGFDVDVSAMNKADSIFGKVSRYIKFYLSTFFKILFASNTVVYVHYPSYSALPALIAGKVKKFPLYVNVHGSDVVPLTKGQRKMHRYTVAAIMKAEKVIVPSAYFSEIVKAKYKIDEDKVVVYPSGGIDPTIFYPLSIQTINEIKFNFGLNFDSITICYASRITEGKGWDTYLEAVAEALSRGAKLNIIMIGSGDQEKECEKLIDKLSLRNSVVRMGLQPQSSLCRIYNAADVFVFPGRRNESLGLVAIEAMACGTPVISSDNAAPKYYIKDNYNGWLVPPNNKTALAKVLVDISKDHSLITRLRAGALETASHFMGEELERQFKKIFNINY